MGNIQRSGCVCVWVSGVRGGNDSRIIRHKIPNLTSQNTHKTQERTPSPVKTLRAPNPPHLIPFKTIKPTSSRVLFLSVFGLSQFFDFISYFLFFSNISWLRYLLFFHFEIYQFFTNFPKNWKVLSVWTLSVDRRFSKRYRFSFMSFSHKIQNRYEQNICWWYFSVELIQLP